MLPGAGAQLKTGSITSASPAVTPGASAPSWFVYTHCPSPQARSYKKEIIHACIAGGDTWRIGLNFIFNMRDLGYDHWVIYVPREQQCSELEAALRGVGTIGQRVCTIPLKLTSLFMCLHLRIATVSGSADACTADGAQALRSKCSPQLC